MLPFLENPIALTFVNRILDYLNKIELKFIFSLIISAFYHIQYNQSIFIINVSVFCMLYNYKLNKYANTICNISYFAYFLQY